MAIVNHWIAVDETGRGAIGLTKRDVINALPGARAVVISTWPAWDLSMAMVRGTPLRFSMERIGDSVGPVRREVRRW